MRTDRWYTAGGLLEVGGYLGTQGHTVGEWMAQCGTRLELAISTRGALLWVLNTPTGLPAMIYGTLDALVDAGMDAHQMRADVFAYAPRP